MSIPNLTYRYLHELIEKIRGDRDDEALEILHNAAHQLRGSE